MANVTVHTANELMRIVDDAIREALAARGLEAFRFDADVNTEQGWVRLKREGLNDGPLRGSEVPGGGEHRLPQAWRVRGALEQAGGR
jgi:hypothetical protein